MVINEFYTEAFDGYEVPENLKLAAMSICNRYDIKGICDPMYIVNVIASTTGTGDGRGNFYDEIIRSPDLLDVGKTLRFAYGRKIPSIKSVMEVLNNTL